MKRFNGKIFLDIREYFQKEPDLYLPTKKGVSLTTEMWEKLLEIQDEVSTEIKKMEERN